MFSCFIFLSSYFGCVIIFVKSVFSIYLWIYICNYHNSWTICYDVITFCFFSLRLIIVYFKIFLSFLCESEKWKSLSLVQLRDTIDYKVLGILQARILEWVAFPSSRGSSQPRDWTQVSHIADRFLTIWAIRETHFSMYLLFIQPQIFTDRILKLF